MGNGMSFEHRKMKKYRKKPVVIEAVQYDPKEAYPFVGRTGSANPYGYIDTLEGTMTVSPGDWIIKGIAGEYYPCKPDIFEATYEEVTDDHTVDD